MAEEDAVQDDLERDLLRLANLPNKTMRNAILKNVKYCVNELLEEKHHDQTET